MASEARKGPAGKRRRRIPARRSIPSRKLKARAEELLPIIERLLRGVYGTASLGNKADPLDELIFIQLSIRTREGSYTDTYKLLEQRVAGDWQELLHLPSSDVTKILRSGGMAEVKYRRLVGQVREIKQRFGRATLEPLHEMGDYEAEGILTALPGVGPKAARCVLLYSLDRDVFPVDGHCRRILDRLGFVPRKIDRKAAHDFLQDLVPSDLRHSLHVNLIHHGRAVCIPGTPRCEPGSCTSK